jgi:hypothetical protein
MCKVNRFLVYIVAMFLFFSFSPAHAAEESLQKQVDDLKKQLNEMSEYYEARIASLEEKLAGNREEGPGDTTYEEHDHGCEKEIPGDCCHRKLVGERIKPIAGIDARFVNAEGKKNKLFLHEATVGVQADITDWLFGFVTFTKHHGEDVEVEEGYGRITFDEWNLAAKAGKFFMRFGPENQVCFFESRTITPSAMREGIFGHEPWADTGVQLSWKLPVGFYSDISVAVVNGDNALSFGDGENEVSNNNFPVVMDWVNFLDTDYGIFRFGPSFSWGNWDRDDKYNVYLLGGNLYYKKGNFESQFEAIYRWKGLPDTEENNAYGYYFWSAYTVPLDYKYLRGIELLGGMSCFFPDTGIREIRFTPQLSFLLNDFMKLRATYEVRDISPSDGNDNRFITQLAMEF